MMMVSLHLIRMVFNLQFMVYEKCYLNRKGKIIREKRNTTEIMKCVLKIIQ